MNRELIINVSPEKVDIALLEDKALVELHHEKGESEFSVGDIYLGRINKLAPSLNAAFVDVGYSKDAFLHYTDLSPQFRTLDKIVKASIAGDDSYTSLNNLHYEAEIVKTGKVNEVLQTKQPILVQILKEPIGTKGPRLTCEISLPGRYLVLMPLTNTIGVSKRVSSEEERKRLQRLMESIKPKNFGVVVRTVAEGKSSADLHEDLSNLVQKWESIIRQLKGAVPPVKIHNELRKTSGILRDMLNASFNSIVVNDPGLKDELQQYIEKIAPEKKNIVSLYKGNRPIFDHYGITRQIKTLFGKTVTIPGGAYLVIERTEAMHVIDVNSGQKLSKQTDQETTALTVNKEAAKEIARQLRLRDLGGIIVVDFIDMRNPANRKALYTYMREMMKNDKARHTVLPLSKFGLMQITRERVRPEVSIATQEVCPTCHGTGQIEASILITDILQRDFEALMDKGYHVSITAHPYIAAYLTKGLPSIRHKWSWKYKKLIRIHSDASYHLTEYHFFDQKTGEELLV
ncbi:MAG: ribonuclease G [Chitinophagales bacterium]|nr:MAG: ribonuclease G [Chitinophagales bacterium]